MSGVYAADGSLNVTVVDGSTRTGLYAADGSINVALSPGSGFVGLYHSCGAWYVTLITSGPANYYAADGSMNVTQSPYVLTGATRVTAVSGSLNPSVGNWTPMGLSLLLLRAGP